ncbi:MAG TPA: penicillin-binding protein 1A [Verrucomicrobiae bacterium]|nr:penicillin-binding protein 1A [Verrucomicrobiae bacterium]
MTLLKKRLILAVLALAAFGAFSVFAFVRWVLIPGLPPTESIKELRLEEPLRVYTADGMLMGEFGAERRAPLDYAELPPLLVQAFLASEDDRFFEHPGVDWQGLARAAFKVLTTGEKSQGGSTITMQLARNVFLSSERTYTRKAREILLALQIERDLSKQDILELYLNKIFLGNRAYGVGAAAQVYFGKDVRDLTLAQTALLAGLPKAPSRDNPTANPERARERRDYVLRRMHELGSISELDYQAALAEPVNTQTERPLVDLDAHYVAEMVRAELFERHGEDIYGHGYTVTTTLDSRLQQAANDALRAALRDYDERHEYRRAEAQLPAEAFDEMAAQGDAPRARIDAALDARPTVVGLLPAAVVEFTMAPKPRLTVLLRDHTLAEVSGEDLEWAKLKAGTLKRGDIVRVMRRGQDWRLTQVPEAQGALVALDPRDGAIRALAGGYDFFEGKFNRVIQARRQPGSGFKPFLYSAALAYGFTPASVILDAPVVFDDPALEDTWRPENYTGKFYGPTRLREALVQSRNLVSIRLLQAIGVDYARNFTSQFGLPAERMPNDLTLALGSATYTPLEMARAYAVFANGGFRVEPYFIKEIVGPDRNVVFKAAPAVACAECPEARIAEAAGVPSPEGAPVEPALPAPEPEPATPHAPVTLADGTPLAPRVVDPRIVYLMRDMLRDAVTTGTGAKARELGRSDIAGKTGTTNDEADAWFNGFHSRMVAISWVGFDQPRPLGRGEVGGRAALPMWMDFMAVALKSQKEDWPERPPGLVSVRINPENGNLAAAGDSAAVFELVQAEHLPQPDQSQPASPDGSEPAPPEDLY